MADFPAATLIGERIFIDCTNLITADFPVAASISEGTFIRCTSLTTASFPEAVSIGSYAFTETGSTSLLITLGNPAPSLVGSTSIFSNVITDKNVTIQKPGGATGYDLAWRADFTSGNSNIYLYGIP
jgi:hypothetical protein